MFLAHITSTPVPQKTDQFITDIKNLNSKSKHYHNDIGNSSVPLKDDDVNAKINYSSNYIYLYIIFLVHKLLT